MRQRLAASNQPSDITVQEATGPPMEVHEVQMPDGKDMGPILAAIENAYLQGKTPLIIG
jgi:hypothetical protein